MAEVAETSEEMLSENETTDAPEAEVVEGTTPAEAEAEAETGAPEAEAEAETAAPETEAAEAEVETEAAEAAGSADAATGEEATGEAATGEEEGEEAEVPAPPRPASPYDLEGDWYVIHSYSGYENKVKANLETRIRSMHMEDRIFEVHIPMEDVVEIKGGKKVTVPRKVFPGYILVRMRLDDDSWYAVRNTPGVTGFVGGNQKPTPLSRREVERFLGVQEEEEKVKPRFKPAWEVGEQVRVVTGPFADFNGVIEDINIDQQKVVVLVNIFGRDTPVELGFDDIHKN
ncbi:MAG TPA: transcription termination/antitermination protein NusG [Acidimicrobiia bacterium]|nr:transcription termination/antitermination protein NusG [Acidimicrobiia bacterium]